jgi:hypothetical protein
MHGEWQLFSPTLLVEIEGSLLIRWIALYALTSVWRRGERGKHTRALARLVSPHWAGPSVAWRGEARRRDARRGEAMGTGARHARE